MPIVIVEEKLEAENMTEPTRDMMSSAVSGTCELTNQSRRMDMQKGGLREKNTKTERFRQKGNIVLFSIRKWECFLKQSRI